MISENVHCFGVKREVESVNVSKDLGFQDGVPSRPRVSQFARQWLKVVR